MKVLIIRCSNPFAWYATLPFRPLQDPIEEEKRLEKVSFETNGINDEGFVKTIQDVAGNGVKGFINVDDVKFIRK